MNIIELFDLLKLSKQDVAGYSANDLIRVEKQLNVERKINPDIDSNTASSLIKALRDHTQELLSVLNTRHLYNFFTENDLPRNHFSQIEPDQEKLRAFIGRFLIDDLEFKLDKALSGERFGTIRELLSASEYLPEESLHRLQKRMTGKLEFAIGRIPREGKPNVSAIGYMRLMSFYEVLSHFASIEMDEKIRIVINLTSDMYNTKREKQFASDVMTCLPSYHAFDDELNRITKSNRNVASSVGASFSGSGSGSGLSGRVIFIIIVLILKIVIFTGKCSNDDSYDVNSVGYGTGSGGINDALNKYTYETRQNDVKAAIFSDYLAMYERDSVTNVKRVDTIQTGQNPFQYLFTQKLANINNLPGKTATISNDTPYDLILMEFTDSGAFNMTSDAYFIKSGEKFDVKISNEGTITPEFAFYFGNELASFNAGSALPIKRSDSLNEFRFRKTAPYAREILNKKFKFFNNVTITKKGGQLKLQSQGLKGVTDSLTNQGEYVF